MKIQKGRPRPSGFKYPFGDMAVGDSIQVEPGDGQEIKTHKAQSAAYSYANKNGVKFSCRHQDDGSIVIWRIA